MKKLSTEKHVEDTIAERTESWHIPTHANRRTMENQIIGIRMLSAGTFSIWIPRPVLARHYTDYSPNVLKEMFEL